MKEGWTYKVFGEVCFYKKEQGQWRDMPYVGMEHIEAHTGHLLGSVSSNTMESSAFRFNKGDVLYGRLRPYLQKVVVAPFDGCCSTEIFPIQSNVLLSEYLKYWFLTIDTTDFLNKSCSGCRMPRANMNLLKLYPISYPSKDEQQRIIEYLDAEFANIDALKVNAENQLQAAKNLFQTTLKELLAPQEDWDSKVLKQLCKNIFAGGDASKLTISKEKNDQYKYPIFANGVNDCGLYGYTNTYKVNEPAITIAARGTIGAAFLRLEPFTPIVRLITLIPNLTLVHPPFLYYMIKNSDWGHTGSSIPQLTIPSIKNIKICFPSIEKQQIIADKLDALSEKVNQLQENYRQTIVLCSDLKQALLKQTFE